jgi:outer membrane protein assembly factor BamA
MRHLEARLSAGVRLSTRFTLVFSGAYNDVNIRRGSRIDDIPATTDLFPNLVGIHGGRTNPLSVALIFDDRDDVTRPVRGWNVIAKVAHVPEGLGNDFDFTRYTFEASYLYPLLTRRQVLGVRVGGEYVESARHQTPFFELASLGGGDDMRGYFLDRFVGKAKVIAGGEYRLKVFDFNFFDIWDVKIDGVGFGDAGRVFLTSDQLAAEFGEDETALPVMKDDMRYSYGGGVRFALGEATIARVDVGFSDEESGLVYLVFGHTF